MKDCSVAFVCDASIVTDQYQQIWLFYVHFKTFDDYQSSHIKNKIKIGQGKRVSKIILKWDNVNYTQISSVCRTLWWLGAIKCAEHNLFGDTFMENVCKHQQLGNINVEAK